MMSKQVTTTLSGHGLSRAELEQFSSIARNLQATSETLKTVSTGWGQLCSYLLNETTAMSHAPCKLTGNDYKPGHAQLPFGKLTSCVKTYSQACGQLSECLSTTADTLIRTYSLYSHTEERLSALFNRLQEKSFKTAPLTLGLLSLGVGTVQATFDYMKQGKGIGVDPYDIVHHTRGAHEHFMQGLADKISRNQYINSVLPAGQQNIDHSVNAVSGRLSSITSRLAHRTRGNNVTVTVVHPTGDFLESTHNIDQALRNLQKLGEGGQGIAYGTVAIQKYKHTDGSTGWVVTIPGTNDHPDSPFGWEQNIELMSDRKEQRMQAASARLVKDAMTKAGIKPQDSVALVGHSQGGIVAASIGSDLSNTYRIDHIVTAGSPVARHPIPKKTWITSIEMDDEIVSSLEGANNPVRDTWLTVSGSTTRIPDDLSNKHRPTAVSGARDNGELSHGMNYQHAAWQHAVTEGKPAQRRHDKHFANVCDGELVETNYYQGRLSH